MTRSPTELELRRLHESLAEHLLRLIFVRVQSAGDRGLGFLAIAMPSPGMADRELRLQPGADGRVVHLRFLVFGGLWHALPLARAAEKQAA